MQSYNNSQKEQGVGKKIILEFLDFLRYKIENDKLTMDEADSLARTIESGIQLHGTIEDFSNFYGKSKENVRVVINRKMFAKPIRLLLYPFNAFRRARPDSWK